MPPRIVLALATALLATSVFPAPPMEMREAELIVEGYGRDEVLKMFCDSRKSVRNGELHGEVLIDAADRQQKLWLALKHKYPDLRGFKEECGEVESPPLPGPKPGAY